MRAASNHRDATVIALLAYARLRPAELRALRWAHIGKATIVVGASKMGRRRTVRLLAPLATDLAEWRMACGRPPDEAPVFPGQDGEPWTAEGFNKWRDGRGRGPRSPRWVSLRHSRRLESLYARTTCATASRRCCCTRDARCST